MALIYRGRAVSGADTETVRELSALVRRQLRLDDACAVSIAENGCTHAACGGAETIVLIAQPGSASEVARIAKPMRRVTVDDIAAAFALRGHRVLC